MPYDQWVKTIKPPSQAPRLVPAKEPLTLFCTHCGNKEVPRMKRCGPHHTAYCRFCGKYIKHVSPARFPAYQEASPSPRREPDPEPAAVRRAAIERQALNARLNFLVEETR